MKYTNTLILGLSITFFAGACKPQIQENKVSGETKMSALVLGKDDRQESQIGNISPILANKVGLVRSSFTDSKGDQRRTSCTATLIAKNFIITASHCLFSTQEGHAPLRNAFFIPGAKTKGHMPYGRFKIIRSYSVSAYLNNRMEVDDNNDFAIMELEKNQNGKHAGEIVGYVSYWGRDNFSSGSVLTVGYPGDLKNDTQYFENNCEARIDYSNELDLTCDVFSGQSGGPIFMYSPEHKFHYLMGVVTSHGKNKNGGSYLSKERHKIVKSIVAGNFAPKNFEEQWTMIEHEHNKEINLFVRNKCNRPIYTAVNFKDLSGNWKSIGLYEVKSSETVKLATTGNGVFYFAATPDQGLNFINRQDIVRDLSNGNGDDVPFEKHSIQTYNDYVKEFGCR